MLGEAEQLLQKLGYKGSLFKAPPQQDAAAGGGDS